MMALPIYLASIGIVCSMIGYFAVSTKQEGRGWDVKLKSLMWALEKGMYTAAFLFLGLTAGCIAMLTNFDATGGRVFGCIIIGLVSGILIGMFTEYFTSSITVRSSPSRTAARLARPPSSS